MATFEFCAICGEPREGHPTVPPGPPTPPPENRPDGFVWRPPHDFKPSGETFAEVLENRDGQIDVWRRRAYAAERKLDAVRNVLGGVS